MAVNEDLTFGPSLVIAKNFIALIARSIQLDASGIDRDLVYFRSEGTWSCMSSLGAGCTMAFDARTSELLVITNDGLVQVVDSEGIHTEYIDRSPEGPSNLQAINGVSRVGNDIVAFGMSRQVYQRVAPGSWVRIDEGIRTNDVAGIKAVCGHSVTNMYSVGFGGELWWRSGSRWVQIDSPTNSKLESIFPVGSDEYIACGAAGVVLRGRAHEWTYLSNASVGETLWAVSGVGGQIFLASMTSLYRLSGADLLPVTDLPGNPRTFGYLSTDGSVLWSSGSLDLLAFEGGTWTKIEPPPTNSNQG